MIEIKRQQLNEDVMDILYGVLNEEDLEFYEKDFLFNLEGIGYIIDDKVDCYNWDDKFEERYGFYPDEDDYRMSELVRDYKAEYKKFQSSPERIKYRAELVKYNRDKGTYGNGDKLDASHKGGKIVGFEAQSKNRGRAEASRLKKK